jgi:glycerol uptake facilitator protein
MTSPVLGEFLGTMILILLGDGVVAAVLLKRSKAEGGGWIVITAGWAFAVMAGVFTAIACGSSDAHLNPAVTIGFAVRDGNFAKFAPYFGAQMLGAIVGAALVWLHHLPHWKETPDTGSKLACFCTAPAIRNTITNLLSEIIATFVLVFVVGAIFSKSVSAAGPQRGSARILWVAWSGASVCRWVGPQDTQSIRPETSGRGSRMQFCRSPAKADRIGAMLQFP